MNASQECLGSTSIRIAAALLQLYVNAGGGRSASGKRVAVCGEAGVDDVVVLGGH